MVSARRLASNFGFVFGSNITALIANSALLLGLPFFIDQNDYGHWQLYQFYSLYLGYVTFGVTDGIYIRLAGTPWASINKGQISSQFWALIVGCAVVFGGLNVLMLWQVGPSDKVLVLIAAAAGAALFIPRTLLTITLQAANRMKLFSIVTAAERILVCLFTAVLVFSKLDGFEWLIWADVLAKAIALIITIALVPELVFGPFSKFADLRNELRHNSISGSKVLFANLSTILIPGIARFSIERNWSVEVFGQISLAFNLSNLMLVLVTSMAVAAFPTLKQIPVDRYTQILKTMRAVTMPLLLCALMVYFPIAAFFGHTLPGYSGGLVYLSFMFAVFVYESQMRLLIANWMKATRHETALMLFNLGGVVAMVALAFLTAYVLRDLGLTILSIVFVSGVRTISAEWYLAKLLKTRRNGIAFFEMLVVSSFMLSVWFLDGLLAILCFTVVLACYLVTVRNSFRQSATLLIARFR